MGIAGAIGLNPELMDGLVTRLTSTGARASLRQAAQDLDLAAAKSYDPAGYGLVQGQDSTLGAGGAARATSAANLVRSALDSLDTLTGVLRGDIDMQRDGSRAGELVQQLIGAADTLFNRPSRTLVWQYTTRAGVHYGSLLRHPDNPRQHWSGNQLRIREAPFFSGPNTTGTNWITNARVRDGLDSVNRFITRATDAIPPRVLRVLGPIGTVLDGGLTYHGAYNDQLAADVDAGYSQSVAEQRAHTSAAATAIGGVAGGVVGGAVGAAAGAAVAGPVGAFVGGMIGSTVGGAIGETVGGWVGDWLNG